jgi:hypothetical protein
MKTKTVATAVVLVIACFAPIGAQQDDTKARDVLEHARKAIGGRRVDAVKSLSVQATAQRNVGNFQMNSDLEILIDLPDKYVKSETASGGSVAMNSVTGFNGDRPLKSAAPGGIAPGGAMIIRMGPGAIGPGAPATPAEKPTPAQQEQIDRQLVRTAREEISRLMLGWFATTHPGLTPRYAYAGEAESPEGRAHVIDVTGADGFAARLFIDGQTDLPLMITYQGPQLRTITAGAPRQVPGGTNQAPRQLSDEERKNAQADAEKQLQDLQRQPPIAVEHTIYFDEWRDVDGITFPHALRRAVAGSTTEEWAITKVKVNPKIDPKKFDTTQ